MSTSLSFANQESSKQVAIIWAQGPRSGRVVVSSGRADKDAFSLNDAESARLEVAVTGAQLKAGAYATRVTIEEKAASFTFYLRDVTEAWPIYLPWYDVVVTTADDQRGYHEIVAAIHARGAVSDWQQIEADEEETYEAACQENRDQICPAWLGLSRDMRIFRIEHMEAYGFWGYIAPRYHSTPVKYKTLDDRDSKIFFMVGPGESCRVNMKRRLEEGCLPILRSEQIEEGVQYNVTAFATSEHQPLDAAPLRGSDWRACYASAGGHMFTPDELASVEDVIAAEREGRDESVICCVRVQAVNTSQSPRYACYKGASLNTHCYEERYFRGKAGFDDATGWSMIGDTVYGVNRFEGRAMPQVEMTVLLAPGESVTWDLLVPHSPISQERAAKLTEMDVQAHLEGCRNFWRAKHAQGTQLRVPEKAIDERIRAGLTHCDINAIGMEPDGPVLATIGWYAPIGSESSPIIQFFDSMGWHQLAERTLDFFLSRQRADGFIQNYKGYELETGPVLWTMGEHYRYTRDDAWVKRVEDNILRACDYLLQWRERNKREELRGKGYGMIDGKVADPDDFFHSFMLNAISYLGVQRSGEMLAKVNPAASQRLLAEAQAYREDIRRGFYESLERGPVVPLGDGTWCPTAGPWTESNGALALYADGGTWVTHGIFGARDSTTGSLYLIIGEVLDANEVGADMLMRFHQALFTVKNGAKSQPYYVRHDFGHIKRDEVNLFLKLYYNQMTALQDRGNYAFWEHYHHASENKTHEEGWFLMQTRWMLYLEDGAELGLLKAIPRHWLADGKEIVFKDAATYFGKLNLDVRSYLVTDGSIVAKINSDTSRLPQAVTIRLPHPNKACARSCQGGVYDGAKETVRIDNYTGQATVVLRF